MKSCYRCGTRWSGYRSEPRAREVCDGCGAYLRCCVNCHHFDHRSTNACKLKTTSFIGSRTALNYCEQFKMADTVLREAESKVSRARSQWEALFRN
jgi:hypothetical protein